MNSNCRSLHGNGDWSSCISPAVTFCMLPHNHMQLFGWSEKIPREQKGLNTCCLQWSRQLSRTKKRKTNLCSAFHFKPAQIWILLSTFVGILWRFPEPSEVPHSKIKAPHSQNPSRCFLTPRAGPYSWCRVTEHNNYRAQLLCYVD